MTKAITAAVLCLLTATQLLATDFGDSLVIVISGGMRGRVNGCGCSSGPEGGIDRRATLFKSLFENVQPIGLDCGAILDLDPEGGVARSRCMMAGLAREGLKVVGVSGRDLYYGAKFLRDAAANAGVTLVSANLVEANGSLPFPAWTTVKVNGVIVAVTSLCEPLPRMAAPGSLSTILPDSAINSLKTSIPRDASMTILLTDMGEASLRGLLNSTDLFDVAFTSSRQVYSATPFQSGNCIVMHPEPDGRLLEAMVLPRSGLAANGRVIKKSIERMTPADVSTAKWLDDCLNTPVPK